ncbi:MAG: TAXI family TRAP transporter solute-binding subunit [Rhodobacteraceae bacterium]|nr:TAXI family TRAP transporter solute-binding subunit [Paracoccaceae bacterium]
MKTLLKSTLASALALSVGVGLASPVMADENLKMATIAPGTSAYLTMTTMATIINQALDDVNITVDATGAATRHMVEVAEGNLDMSMTSPTVYKFLREGTVMYQELENHAELAQNLSLMFWFPLGQYHVVTYADDNIMSLDEIAGHTVFLGPPGGGAWAAARNWVVATTGYEPDVDYENIKASWSSAFQGFQDRQFDVYVISGIAPFPQLEQLSLTSDLRILGLTEEEYAGNQAAQDFIEVRGEELGIIPVGIYGEGVVNTQDVYTLGAAVGVTARVGLDEDLVYRMTKAFWEGHANAMNTHPWLVDLTLEYAVADGQMALHPGALRYYEEIGLEIPEGSR